MGGWPLRLCASALAVLAAGARAEEEEDQLGFAEAGRHFSYIIFPLEGQVRAFGRNNYGQLGVNSTEDENNVMNVVLPEGEMVTQAAAGAFHGLFLTKTGNVYATGRNRFGQFGEAGAPDMVEMPRLVATGVKAVTAGYGHSLFLMSDGTVEAAGLNKAGQLGLGTTQDMQTRTKIEGLPQDTKITAIAAGYDFSYFLTEAGEVYAAGQNFGGQLGIGNKAPTPSPTKVDIDGKVASIAAGESHGLFLVNADPQTQDGQLWATGSNAMGQYAHDEVVKPTGSPVLTGFPVHTRRVFAGGDSTCVASRNSGELYCAGSNLDGQLGLGKGDSTNGLQLFRQSTRVPGIRVHAMGIGDTHSIVKKEDYSATLVAGSNTYGELGDLTNEDRFTFKELTLDYSGTTTGTTTATVTATTTTEQERVVKAIPLPVGWMLSIIGGASALTVLLVVARGVRNSGAEDEADLNELEVVRAAMSQQIEESSSFAAAS